MVYIDFALILWRQVLGFQISETFSDWTKNIGVTTLILLQSENYAKFSIYLKIFGVGKQDNKYKHFGL